MATIQAVQSDLAHVNPDICLGDNWLFKPSTWRLDGPACVGFLVTLARHLKTRGVSVRVYTPSWTEEPIVFLATGHGVGPTFRLQETLANGVVQRIVQCESKSHGSVVHGAPSGAQAQIDLAPVKRPEKPADCPAGAPASLQPAEPILAATVIVEPRALDTGKAGR